MSSLVSTKRFKMFVKTTFQSLPLMFPYVELEERRQCNLIYAGMVVKHHEFGEGNVALYAAPNHFLCTLNLNKIV